MQGVSKNVDKSEIALFREAPECTRCFFFIKIDCFGTYNVE